MNLNCQIKIKLLVTYEVGPFLEIIDELNASSFRYFSKTDAECSESEEPGVEDEDRARNVNHRIYAFGRIYD